MDTAGRTYVLFATIALVAMVDRMGWIGWSTFSQMFAKRLTPIEVIVAYLALVPVLLGSSLVILAAIDGVLSLLPDRAVVQPPP